MPRTARKKVESRIYHIVLRGINKQTIFYDDEDREVFLNRIKLAKEKKDFKVYAFCLMNNHIHLLIKEEEYDTLGNIFRRILSSYVFWYNLKYKRIGNLFQDRYKSEGIENDAHLLCALRYIHQNPVKAQMVEKVEDYKWSSHKAYKNSNKSSFVDVDFVLSILGGVKRYNEFINQLETVKFIEDDYKKKISDAELLEKIKEIMKTKEIYDILKCSRAEMESVILMIRQNIIEASIRQISRVTGISANIIRHIK